MIVAKNDAPAAPTVSLRPGERLALHGHGATPIIDRPEVEGVTAWRRGEAMFNDASLKDAIAEINRYGKVQLRVDDPAIAALRVSGVFATRDSIEFANVIAKLHRLDVVQVNGVLVLSHGNQQH